MARYNIISGMNYLYFGYRKKGGAEPSTNVVYEIVTASGNTTYKSSIVFGVPTVSQRVVNMSSGYDVLTTEYTSINSIQHVHIEVPTDREFANATINSVTPDKSVILINGRYVANTAHEPDKDYSGLLSLQNATTVRGHHVGIGTATKLYGTVLEFGSGVTSVQRGVITITGKRSSKTTIKAVDLDKSILNHCGDASPYTFVSDQCVKMHLYDSTTIEAYRNGTDGTSYASWEVIEFE